MNLQRAIDAAWHSEHFPISFWRAPAAGVRWGQGRLPQPTVKELKRRGLYSSRRGLVRGRSPLRRARAAAPRLRANPHGIGVAAGR
jgi:hypothetical protein